MMIVAYHDIDCKQRRRTAASYEQLATRRKRGAMHGVVTRRASRVIATRSTFEVAVWHERHSRRFGFALGMRRDTSGVQHDAAMDAAREAARWQTVDP
jgi:hypothetical protein